MSSSSPPRDRGRSSSARAQRSQSRDAARASLLDLPTTTPVGDLENANEGIDTDNADDLDDATDGNGNDSGTSNDDSGLAKANDGIGSTNVNYGSGVANDNDASASSGLKTPFSGVDGLDIVGNDGSALGSVGTSNTSLRADADVRKMTAAIHAQVEGGSTASAASAHAGSVASGLTPNSLSSNLRPKGYPISVQQKMRNAWEEENPLIAPTKQPLLSSGRGEAALTLLPPAPPTLSAPLSAYDSIMALIKHNAEAIGELTLDLRLVKDQQDHTNLRLTNHIANSTSEQASLKGRIDFAQTSLNGRIDKLDEEILLTVRTTVEKAIANIPPPPP